MKIADLSALFYLNKRLTSPVARKHTKSDGYKLLERFEKHPDYYKPNNPINTFKKQLKKMIDFQ